MASDATASPDVQTMRRHLRTLSNDGRLTLVDARRIQRSLDRLQGLRDPKARDRQVERLGADISAAERRLESRAAGVPKPISYPPELPVSQRRADLLEVIRDNQVVIVAGETGSGKTTQLPKICLELGRGVRGMIGHTQPRRLAARTVAERVAEELGTQLGETVGYTVRFTDKVSDTTLVKLMTDGILLTEIQRDRFLNRYDTLIIDEAHERSLNIDFILGYLKQLLPRRPDLKVIITSATIDPERFSRHFEDAPIVEVSGRTYPVEVRYRPLLPDNDDVDGAPAADRDGSPSEGGDGEPRDQVSAVVDAVRELLAEPSGDVLVFLSGEREIRDTADALRGALGRWRGQEVEILPLYARLSAAEQHRVFAPHPGRRVVLATNVAETSLTVPGIRYVVDPGTARISRYSHRTKVQRLPIERISQASANQRKGRCGRVAEGICIRLYSEEDFGSRPEFTEPEILRTNLASVILQMAALGLGEVEDFPFVEPPDRRQVRDGVQLLEELGALDPKQPDPRKRLTPVGRQLAQLPIDPRLARMVLAAEREGALREVLVIAAGLSIQDPRERPAEHQQAADEMHRRFADPTSDFMAYVNLWRYLREQQKALSSSQFRRMCKREFLNYLRVREWQDLVAQLRQVAGSIGLSVGSSWTTDAARVHSALLAGMLSHVGLRDERRRDYQGARGTRFAIFPGSALFKKQPALVMAAELVETSRLWGRTVAKVEPEWVEAQGAHVVKRSYSEPHWEARRGAVMAVEKVTLYGVPIIAGRKVSYAKVDPELSRELFIRHALVEGDWKTQHQFFHHNQELLEDIEELEARARRRDIVVDDETLFEFYDKRIPDDVVSGRHFDAWWKKERRKKPDLLTFTPDLLISDEAEPVDERDFPTVWEVGDLRLPVTYQFEPGTAADGVTVHVPLDVLNRLDDSDFEWQIPGLRNELVTALIKALPKALRRGLVPAPDTAAQALRQIHPDDGPLLRVLADELQRLRGVPVEPEDFDLSKVPTHLRITFSVEDHGRVAASDTDLDVLRERLKVDVRSAISRAADSTEVSGLTSWPDDDVPKTFSSVVAGHEVQGFPALVDEGSSVALRVLPSPDAQQQAMRSGVRRLLLMQVPSVAKQTASRLSNADKLSLSANPHGSVAALLDDCTAAAVDGIVEDAGGPAWDAAGFARLSDAVSRQIDDRVAQVVTVVARILTAARDVERGLKQTSNLTLLPALTDMRAQLEGLVHTGFVTETGFRRLPDVLRYLRGMLRRLDKLPEDPGRDKARTAQVHLVQNAYDKLLARQPKDRPVSTAVADIRWMIEEFRVSLFAQQLGTAHPVSAQRIEKAIRAAQDA
ncbi:MAG TPA: ATP-dependent RNA helicase HrpA [Actinomycetales bacterium]|nr:ATP-dependent RNA helicase HrpA [Actinomycetales bacterium]